MCSNSISYPSTGVEIIPIIKQVRAFEEKLQRYLNRQIKNSVFIIKEKFQSVDANAYSRFLHLLNFEPILQINSGKTFLLMFDLNIFPVSIIDNFI